MAILRAVAGSALIFLDPDDEPRGILVGAIVVALVGGADDLLDLSPDVKFARPDPRAAIPVAAACT